MKDQLIRKLKELIVLLEDQVRDMDIADWEKRKDLYNEIVALEKQIDSACKYCSKYVEQFYDEELKSWICPACHAYWEKQIEQDEFAKKIANTDYMDTERDTITTHKKIDENERT